MYVTYHKWFVWSEKKKRYIPLPGVNMFCRGFSPNVDMFGREAPICFSIPMFNVHNAVK